MKLINQSTTHLNASSQTGLIVGAATFFLVIISAFWIGNPASTDIDKRPAAQEQGKLPDNSNNKTLSKGNELIKKASNIGREQEQGMEHSNLNQFLKSPANLEEHIKSALEHGSRSTRENMLNQLAPYLAANDPQKAAALVLDILKSQKTSHAAPPFVKAMVTEMIKEDHVLAVDWLETLPEELRNTGLNLAVQSWISSDLNAASQWVNQLQDSGQRNTYTQHIGNALLDAPPSTAGADWAQSMANSPDAIQHLSIISRVWAKTDQEGVLEWAQQLPNPYEQVTVTAGIANIVAQNGIDAVEQWIGDLPFDELKRDHIIAMVAYDLDGQKQGMGLELARRFDHFYAKEREQSNSNP
jgi:hypothetical protein